MVTPRIRRNLANLIPEVKALVDEGKLHQFDAEWIGGLAAESQLAAAEKVIRAAPVIMLRRHDKEGSKTWVPRFRSKIG